MTIGHILAPPRFVLFLLALAGAAPVAVAAHGWQRGGMIAFDVAAAAFLVAVAPLLRGQDAAAMRAAARRNDANRAVLLGFSAIVSLAVLAAVGAELARPAGGDAVLVIATLALAWLFSNTVYALHYAHLFYLPAGAGDAGGLDFPGAREPDYADFAYFAFTLGMTFQTSDVALAAPAMRRVALGHTLAAFAFNLGVLAFTINVLGN